MLSVLSESMLLHYLPEKQMQLNVRSSSLPIDNPRSSFLILKERQFDHFRLVFCSAFCGSLALWARCGLVMGVNLALSIIEDSSEKWTMSQYNTL